MVLRKLRKYGGFPVCPRERLFMTQRAPGDTAGHRVTRNREVRMSSASDTRQRPLTNTRSSDRHIVFRRRAATL